jgi:flavin reductase (DIM6/NTAB) family NADH-FMN oxidoreductase RutF
MSSDRSRERFASVGPDEFRRVCGRFATGVAIAGAVDAEGIPHGLTVSSFTAVSLVPPLILICLGHEVTSIDVFRETAYFGVSVLRDGQRDISDRFARKGLDRFDGLQWRRGETGVPLIEDALATMECGVRQRIAAGDHDIFVGELLRSHAGEGSPLIHWEGRYRVLG